MTPDLPAKVVVLIVGYCNPDDVSLCLGALARADPEPSFEVFVAENGGPSGMDALVEQLDATASCRRADPELDLTIDSAQILRRRLFDLVDASGTPRSRVHVAEMAENLGYAGGVNGWLRPLLLVPGWEGAWVLNPDTQVMPSALSELVSHAARYRKGMVGSRLVAPSEPDRGYMRGLAWSRLSASTLAVDRLSPAIPDPDRQDIESRIDAPSGASCYVTRTLIDRIGLMDERYFLYYEDLDWGFRAKRADGVGYAHSSVVVHQGGTTIGTSADRTTVSPLAVYLEFRNRILFVRARHPPWLAWTVIMQVVHAGSFGAAGAFRNMVIALQGVIAGLKGQTGRPDRVWHVLARARRSTGERRD